MKKIKKSDGRIIKIWFASYLAILIIPLLVNYFLFQHSKSIIEEEIDNSRETLILRLKNDIDEDLYLLRKMAFILGQDSKTLKMINDDRKNLLDVNKYNTIEYLDYIETFTNSIEGMYVLLHLGESDSVIFNGIYANGEFFYENYLNRGMFPSEDVWIGLVEGKYKNDFFTTTIKVNSESGLEESYVVYGSSLPFGSVKNSTATLMVMMEDDRLLEQLNQYKLSEDGIVFIIDQNDNIVLSTEENIGIENLEYKTLATNSHNKVAKRNGKDVILIGAESDEIPWKYVVVSEKDVYLEKDNQYEEVVLISVGLYFIIGMMMAFLFSRRNYKPIEQMVQLVSDHSDEATDSRKGDYDYLKSAFENAFFKMDELENKISEQQNVMRNNFLFRLLTGIAQDEDVINESLRKYNFEFHNPYFFTVSLNINLHSNSEGGNSVRNYVKIAEYFKSTKELEENSYYIIRDNYIIFVCNTEDNCQEELKESLFLMIDQLKQEMENLISISISVGISDVYDSVYGLVEAYTESMNCLEYVLMYAPEEILLNKDLIAKGAYYYPITLEQKLINNIKAGNKESALETLKEIYTKNFDENKIGINMGRNLLFDLSSSMLKSIDAVATDELDLSREIVKVVTYTKKIEDIKVKLKEYLLQICDYYKDQQKSIETISYLEEVNEYIADHYMNANLNISSIAEKFNLTPSYLSKLYKAESGKSILNQINEVRVEEAKRLLIHSDLTNNEIGIAIGILNDTSLNRVFKKLEGITPGQYRKNMKKSS